MHASVCPSLTGTGLNPLYAMKQAVPKPISWGCGVIFYYHLAESIFPQGQDLSAQLWSNTMSRKKKILALVLHDLDRLAMWLSMAFLVLALIGDIVFDKPSGEYRYLFGYAVKALVISFVLRILPVFLGLETVTKNQE